MECKWPESLYGQGLYGIFEEADADIFCIQESKLQEGQISWSCRAIISTGIMR